AAAAPNRALSSVRDTGALRQHLFDRLNVVNLRLPALRDRRQDIPRLAAHLLDRSSHDRGAKFTLSDEALRVMMDYAWPGNVRELEHAVDRACTMSSGPVLHLGDFPTQLQQQGLESRRPVSNGHEPDPGSPGVMTLADLERQAILD